MSKRILVILLTICMLCTASCREERTDRDDPTTPSSKPEYGTVEGGIRLYFKTEAKYFSRLSSRGGETVYLKGVNMGLTEATTSLDNPNVSYSTYLDWFAMIAAMNANTVRVFSVMPPQFYKALRDYNEGKAQPLYLIHGIWFNETYMESIGDAYDGTVIYDAFTRAARETVDIVHGNSSDTTYGEIVNAVYDCDVSPYLAGYVLGLEWTPDFVTDTNAHMDKTAYKGNFLSTAPKASPFEAFLCSVGDVLIQYETDTYQAQAPVAFLNWATTDVIEHTNEPFSEEDAVSVNTENILPESRYKAGLFAAVDAYPYYPEFMNHQEEYVSFQDPETGENNSYRAYIRDLLSRYSVPLLIAEVGLPTSRGIAHSSVMGYDQGGLTEEEQGRYVGKMMRDIHAEGCAGALIFSWQDEWFKQTWNTIKYAPGDASLRTPNVMSAEQSYGILAMEPGEKTAVFCDGNYSEWNEDDLVCKSDGFDLYVKYDEAYLYLYVASQGNYDFERDTIYLPIRTTGLGSKRYADKNLSFEEEADFIVVLNGKENTRVLCDAYYDAFYYLYGVMRKIVPENGAFSQPASGIYNPVRQFLSNEMELPETGDYIPPQYYESGLLSYGNNHPEQEDFNSQADFYGSSAGVELRIPWYLLNVLNPAAGVALGDFHAAGEIVFTDFNDLKIGISAESGEKVRLYDSGFTNITEVKYHTRLKKSYDILKQILSAIS